MYKVYLFSLQLFGIVLLTGASMMVFVFTARMCGEMFYHWAY